MKSKPITLRAVRPNAGIARAYQKQLDDLIKQMQADIRREVLGEYEANPPEMAQDAAADLMTTMTGLRAVWQRRFDELSGFMARHFAKQVADRTDASMKAALRKAGFSVRLTITPQQHDIIQASVGENVSLIKSIPSDHFTQVEGAVMRSVAKGGDLHELSNDLQARYGVTRRRAATIARDQNRKATAMLERSRQTELGLKAKWLHSAGGKTPRPTHVANSGKEYDPQTGWYDPDVKAFIWPGTLINCRCVSRSIVPGRLQSAA